MARLSRDSQEDFFRMVAPVREALVPAESSAPVSMQLAEEFAAHASPLRRQWVESIRREGLLQRVSDEDLRGEATETIRTWCDFLTPERSAIAAEELRQVARRSVIEGLGTEETLRAMLSLRDVCREHLFVRFAGDPEKLVRILPIFEQAAQRLMVQIAVSCAEEREVVARQRMHGLIEAGMLLTVEEGLEPVLQKIVDLARDIVGARYAAITALDDRGRITQFATAGMDDQLRERVQALPKGQGVLGAVLMEPLRLSDIQSDPRSIGFPPNHPVMRTFLGVPIAFRGRIYGNLYLTDKRNGDQFTPDDELLVTTFASQAAAAIEHARSTENLRLLDESQRRERQHAELLQRVIAAQEEERKRVARELHDHTGQSLTSLMIGLRRLEGVQSLADARAAIAEMRQHAAQALEELHHLAFELRPAVLDDLGLAVALERYAGDFARRTSITMETQVDALRGVRLEPAAEIALYRIVQEALTNVAKHAQATTVSVVVQPRGESLMLIVEDDGKGFEVPHVSDTNGRHFGLMGMHERVSLLGGKLTIESAPGSGTTVYVELPLKLA